jgi:hypothetical protein
MCYNHSYQLDNFLKEIKMKALIVSILLNVVLVGYIYKTHQETNVVHYAKAVGESVVVSATAATK